MKLQAIDGAHSLMMLWNLRCLMTHRRTLLLPNYRSSDILIFQISTRWVEDSDRWWLKRKRKSKYYHYAKRKYRETKYNKSTLLVLPPPMMMLERAYSLRHMMTNFSRRDGLRKNKAHSIPQVVYSTPPRTQRVYGVLDRGYQSYVNAGQGWRGAQK